MHARTRRVIECIPMAIFRALPPGQLEAKRVTPAGTPIAVWKWLRALVEHVVHHRGQIYSSSDCWASRRRRAAA